MNENMMKLEELINAADGSPRSRMKIACHALWMACEARKPALSEAQWKQEISTHGDDVLRMGVTFDFAIDGLRPPNPYKARMAELAPAIEQLSAKLDAVMLNPASSLQELKDIVDSTVRDPAWQEASDLARRSKLS